MLLSTLLSFIAVVTAVSHTSFIHSRDVASTQAADLTCVDAGYQPRTYADIGEACDRDPAQNIICKGSMGWSGGLASCVPNSEGTSKGTCVGQNTVAQGDACFVSYDCKAGLWCKRSSATAAAGVCTKVGDLNACVYDQMEIYGGMLQRQCQKGSMCMPDNKCHILVDEGAACANSGPLTPDGKDASKIVDGPVCVGSCVSKKCQRLKDGADCTLAVECQSNSCYTAPGDKTGKCTTPKAIGDACTTDKDCSNPLAAAEFGAYCSGTSATDKKCTLAFAAPAGAFATSAVACNLGLIVDSNAQCADPSTVYCLKDSDCGAQSPAYACNCNTRRCYATYSGKQSDCDEQIKNIQGVTGTLTQFFNSWVQGNATYAESIYNQFFCCAAPGEAFSLPPAGAGCPACSPKAAYACLSGYFKKQPTFTDDMCKQGTAMLECWRKSNCNKYAPAALSEVKNNCFVTKKTP